MKEHLLLISGNKDELKKFMGYISHCNGSFKCTYAQYGAQALEMLRYLVPDYIFIDPALEDTDALQLVSAIRFEPRLQHVKLYIYSREIDDDITKMAKLLGASGCIERSRPFGEVCRRFSGILDDDLQPAYVLLKR